MVSTRVTPDSQQIPVNVCGGNRYGRYSKISSEFTQNLYLLRNGYPPEHELFEQWLVNFLGYSRVLNFGTFTPPTPTNPPTLTDTINFLPEGTGRGIFNSIRGGFLLAVINSTVYRISSAFGVTMVGTVNSTQGDVYIAENLSNQICIVDGVNAYIYSYGITPPTFAAQDLSAANGLVPTYVRYHNDLS